MAAPFLGAALVLAIAAVPVTAEERGILAARIFDTVGLAEQDSESMLRTAGDALSPAEIHITWKPCAGAPLLCQAPHGRDLVVRIVERHGPAGGGSCAFAMVDRGHGFVSLSVDCARRTLASLERRWTSMDLDPLTPGEVLGFMLAHEIAHVLLPEARHSRRGLFKARIHARDWRTVRRGGLGFSREDVERLRSAAALLARRAPAVTKREGPERRPPDQIVEHADPAERPRQGAGDRGREETDWAQRLPGETDPDEARVSAGARASR